MAVTRGPTGIGSELDEALVRAGRYLRRGVVSADVRTLQKTGGREADSFYRDRWSYDKVVRSTHGVNCTGSCSWKVYVKDGIITWEAQQTDYPSTGPDRPDYEPRGCPRGAAFSWYTYSPTRVRYPYVRGVLLELFREAKARHGGDPVEAWAEITGDPEPRGPLQVGPRQGRLRPGELGGGGGARSRPRTCTRSALGSGPDRGVQPDPGDEHGQPCRGRAVPRADRRADAVVL